MPAVSVMRNGGWGWVGALSLCAADLEDTALSVYIWDSYHNNSSAIVVIYTHTQTHTHTHTCTAVTIHSLYAVTEINSL